MNLPIPEDPFVLCLDCSQLSAKSRSLVEILVLKGPWIVESRIIVRIGIFAKVSGPLPTR